MIHTFKTLLILFSLVLTGAFFHSAHAAGVDDFVITVKTDNPGTSLTNQFLLPTTGGGYNYNIDCNDDGTDEATGQTGNYTCDYTSLGGIGTYTVRIEDNSGLGTGFPRIYFNAGGDRRKILTIEQWGTGTWTSMENAFDGASNLTIEALDTPDLSVAVNMSLMFQKATALGGGVNGNWAWDTSNIVFMTGVFNEATNFNKDIGSWDTSGVTNMQSLFRKASNFNQDLSSWDLSNVYSAQGMFFLATSFNSPVGLNNISGINITVNMFEDATSFNQDVSGWDLSGTQYSMAMFQGATSFNQDVSLWDTSALINATEMFRSAPAFDSDLSSWDVTNLTAVTDMFFGTTLSTANYDALLIGWDAQVLNPSLSFNGGNSTYCQSQTARANMISSDLWTITDGGPACNVAIAITAPTKTDNTSITDTTIQVVDDFGVLVANVTVDGATTATTSSFSCLQTTAAQVDCTISIDSSGDLTIAATNTAGESITAAEAGYVITAPVLAAPGTPDMTAGTDSGTSSTDNITSDTTPDFDLTCVTNSTVNLISSVDGAIGSGVCTAGTVTITASALSEGAANITATQTDLALNTSAASGALAIEIDTTPDAAPGTPDMTAGTDSGTSSTDNITSDTTPDFDLTCVTNSTVNLISSVDGAIGSGVCTAGTVTITASALSEGAANITATQTDLAANTSAASGALAIEIDTTPDAAPGTPDMTAGTDSGTSSTDNITSDTTPDFDLTCVTNSTVNLISSVDGAIGSGVCTAGTVTITASALSEGAANITATQTDLALNTSAASGALAVTIDTTAATLLAPTVTSPTSDTTPTITGSCVTGDVVTIYIDAGAIAPTDTCASSTYSVTPSVALAEATYAVTATALDLAGNTSAVSPSTSLVVDLTLDPAPGTPDMTAGTDSGTSSTDNITSDTTPDFDLTCVTNSTVNLISSVDGAIGSGVCTAGTVTITASALSEGAANITATQTDLALNTSAASGALAVTIDTTAATLLAPTVTSPTSDTTPTITGSCVTGDVVTIYIDAGAIAPTDTCASSTYSVTPSVALAEATYAVTATALDLAGNTSAVSPSTSLVVDLTLDPAPGTPDMTAGTDSGTSSTDNITSDTTPDFDLTCVTNSTVNLISSVDGAIGSGVCTAGTVTITASALSEGAANITATQTDLAANTSAASGALAIEIDTTPDAAPGTPDMTAGTDSGTSSTDNITSDTTPDFDLTCVTNSTVNLISSVDGAIGSGVCTAGTVTITASALSEGAANITATQTDLALNTSAASGALAVTIDTTAATLLAPTVTSPTSDTTPTITGSCVTGDVVTIYIDAGAIAPTDTCASSTYSVTPSVALAEATYAVTATALDLAGNTSAVSPSTSLVVDLTTPAPSSGSGSRSGSSSSTPYVCKDELASNYSIFGNHRQSECVFGGDSIDTCSASQTLTQSIKIGARDGQFNSYTGGIVTEVKILQAHMNRLGFTSGPEDGIFGSVTDRAVKQMQTDLGTVPDGIVGSRTRELVNNSCESGDATTTVTNDNPLIVVQEKIAEIQEQLETTPACSIDYYRLIKLGAIGEDVRQVQVCLNSIGYSVGTADGKYGPNTYNGVIQYQTAQGLAKIDGIVGPNTVSALNELSN